MCLSSDKGEWYCLHMRFCQEAGFVILFFFDGHRQMSFMVEVVVQHVARDVYRSSRVVVDTSL